MSFKAILMFHCQMQQKWPFLNPFTRSYAYVVYEWSHSVFSSRIDLEKQTSAAMALGRLQITGPTVQKELENTVSSPSYKLYSGCLELFQTND